MAHGGRCGSPIEVGMPLAVLITRSTLISLKSLSGDVLTLLRAVAPGSW
jgi:hypothetical protein